MTMFIAFGAAFEVPVVVVVLARLGIVSIEKLKRVPRLFHRRLAFIVAAVITPPDVVSQLALAIPMCLLYESASGRAVPVHQAHAGAEPEGGHAKTDSAA
jgi:sec-independent protein translocase protein TatC